MWDNYGHFTHSCCILMTFKSGWNALHTRKEIVRVYENLSLRGDKYYLNHFESLVKKDNNQKYVRGKLLAKKNEGQDLKKKKTTKKEQAVGPTRVLPRRKAVS